MNHIEALQKLISRNKAFAQKKGVTTYVIDTDQIVNALLTYVNETETEITRLRLIEANRAICFEIWGIDPQIGTIDNEFLERYIKFDVVSEIHLTNGGVCENYKLDEKHILDYSRLAQIRIRDDFEMYKILKPLILEGNLQLEAIYPQFVNFVKYNYTDAEVISQIKQTIYYQHD
ncbi:MAG: hypothetical protein Q7U47_01395 [Paludibacter sp.]|nr:hypothetical protein [Paludibacter sp.]